MFSFSITVKWQALFRLSKPSNTLIDNLFIIAQIEVLVFYTKTIPNNNFQGKCVQKKKTILSDPLYSQSGVNRNAIDKTMFVLFKPKEIVKKHVFEAFDMYRDKSCFIPRGHYRM